MGRKIIFFDIDGTILSPKDFTISESTRSAIKRAQANGHLAFINTGRTLAEIEKEITDIGFDGYVCGCGTYITYGDKVLLHHTVESDIIKKLIDDLHRYKIEAVFEGTAAIYYDNPVINPYLAQVRHDQIHSHGFNIRSFEDSDIAFDKFCMVPLKEGDYNGFRAIYNNHFEFIDRGHNFYEIVPLGFSKATGIEFLEKYMDIPYEDTFALGDSSNDLPMLKYVRHSIAMANASEVVLNMASFITKDVDNGGVEHALKHYGII